MKKLLLFATMFALFTSLGVKAQNPSGVPILVSKTYLNPNSSTTNCNGYGGSMALEVVSFSTTSPHITSVQTTGGTYPGGGLIIKHKENNNVIITPGLEDCYVPVYFRSSFEKPTCAVYLPDTGMISGTLTVHYKATSASTGKVTYFYETTTFYHYPKYVYMPY